MNKSDLQYNSLSVHCLNESNIFTLWQDNILICILVNIPLFSHQYRKFSYINTNSGHTIQLRIFHLARVPKSWHQFRIVLLVIIISRIQCISGIGLIEKKKKEKSSKGRGGKKKVYSKLQE